jgi:hypothetical protein
MNDFDGKYYASQQSLDEIRRERDSLRAELDKAQKKALNLETTVRLVKAALDARNHVFDGGDQYGGDI